MPRWEDSKYLRVQSAGGTDRGASISPTGPQLLEQNLPKMANQQAKGTAVFGQHDLPSAAVGPARPFDSNNDLMYTACPRHRYR
jgi:hypothetical protein